MCNNIFKEYLWNLLSYLSRLLGMQHFARLIRAKYFCKVDETLSNAHISQLIIHVRFWWIEKQ